MQLRQLLSNLKHTIPYGASDREIRGLAHESRQVKPGFLFVAVKGHMADGHAFIEYAIQNGAVAVLGESFSDENQNPVH